MPNHCTNEVTITFKNLSQKEAFRKWVDNGDDNPLDFERILPYPKGKQVVEKWVVNEDMKDDPKLINRMKREKDPIEMNGEWNYEWCCENWGTKWNSYSWDFHSDIWNDEYEEDFIDLKFETAWGPPTGILKKIHEKFPDFSYIRWFYRDEADMFCGYLDVDVGISNA